MIVKIVKKFHSRSSVKRTAMLGVCMLLAVIFLFSAYTWAGNLAVDNLEVTGEETIYGKLQFVSGLVAMGGVVSNYTLDGTNFTAHIFENSGTFIISEHYCPVKRCLTPTVYKSHIFQIAAN